MQGVRRQNDAVKPATVTIHQGRRCTAGIGTEAAGTRNCSLSSLPLPTEKLKLQIWWHASSNPRLADWAEFLSSQPLVDTLQHEKTSQHQKHDRVQRRFMKRNNQTAYLFMELVKAWQMANGISHRRIF